MLPVTFDKYEKISDDLCILGNNAILRFNVSLARKSEDGTRTSFHKEYQYNSDKYINCSDLVTIRRSFDYFISIENFKAVDGVKEFIMITIQDIMYVRSQLKMAIKWYMDEQFANLFAKKDNKVIMCGKVEPIYITGLPMDKQIILEPIAVNTEDNKHYIGLRMYLGTANNYIDMSVDRFMGFAYLLDSINMYESAQILLNYLQRPQLGTNLYSFSYSNTSFKGEPTENEFISSKNNNRTIQNKNRQKSFFSKSDELDSL